MLPILTALSVAAAFGSPEISTAALLQAQQDIALARDEWRTCLIKAVFSVYDGSQSTDLLTRRVKTLCHEDYKRLIGATAESGKFITLAPDAVSKLEVNEYYDATMIVFDVRETIDKVK